MFIFFYIFYLSYYYYYYYYYYIFFILRVLHLVASRSGPFDLKATMDNSTSLFPDTSLTLQLRELKMGPIGCTETSVGKYHSTLGEILKRAQVSFILGR